MNFISWVLKMIRYYSFKKWNFLFTDVLRQIYSYICLLYHGMC